MVDHTNPSKPRVLFIGGARYTAPLDPTTRKKFEALARIADVEVIGFNRRGLRPPYTFSDHARFFTLPAPHWALLRYLIFFSLGTLLTTVRILRSSREILIAQSPYEGLVGVWAKGIGRLLGRRVALVVESHGDFQRSVFLHRSVRVPWLFQKLMSQVARLSLKGSDVFRAISSATEEQMRRWANWKEEKPVFRYPAWTDLSVFLATNETQAGPRSKEILFVGVVTPTKGLEWLLEAFAKMSDRHLDAKLVVVGSQHNVQYVQSIRERARQLGITEKMKLIDHLDQTQLAEVMSRARCLVLPSRSEGFGRVLVEAMATGTPVIGTRVGGIPEVIDHEQTGFLFEPGDVAELAERIDWTLEFPESADAMGQRGRARVHEFWSEKAYLDGYRAVFESAMKARGAP